MTNIYMKKALTYIEGNKERFVEELFDLLRIPSISAQPSLHKEDMVRCAEWLAASLVKAGADHAQVMPTNGNPVVYAEKMAVESSTTDHAALVKSFEDGYEQAARQLPEWLRWLGV